GRRRLRRAADGRGGRLADQEPAGQGRGPGGRAHGHGAAGHGANGHGANGHGASGRGASGHGGGTGVNRDRATSHDPSHRMPPRQERWPTATPAEGWPSYQAGAQQAVATAAYPAVRNGYGGYAGAADDFDGRVIYRQDGYGQDGYGQDGY